MYFYQIVKRTKLIENVLLPNKTESVRCEWSKDYIYKKKNAFSVLGNMENSGSNCLITIDLSGSHHLTAQDFSETNWLITPNTQ